MRVTDESVPDAGKKRYALSLSIHGIERAGVEGGTRAMEDLVTALHDRAGGQAGRARPTVKRRRADVRATSSRRRSSTSPTRTRTAGAAARSPRAASSSSATTATASTSNRDWPDIGFSFRALQRPVRAREPRRCSAFYERRQAKTGGQFAAGDDLHGQPFADALSYTLLPHGKHDYAKNLRIRETAKTIHRDSEQAL